MQNEVRKLINSRGEFHEALRAAFAEVVTHACRQVWLCDTDFADWPLNEPGVIDNLTQWAQPHRKMVVLAQNFDDLMRRHPRWVAWRRQRANVVECRIVEPMEQGQMPVLLTAPGLVTVKLVDAVRHRGTCSHQAADGRLASELIDAVLQRSAEAFPATTLGL